MEFKLPALPFDYTQVAGWLSSETLEFHYDRHHRGYIDKLNYFLKDHPLKNAGIEEIIKFSSGDLFNNASQAWNHTFYWNSIGPIKSNPMKNRCELNEAIQKSFGSFENFMDNFLAAGSGLFGSGWVWLVQDDSLKKLEIIQTHDAGNPLSIGLKPLLTCDVWEHAYYIDFRNERAKYMQAFLKAINWDFVENNFFEKKTRDLTSLMASDHPYPSPLSGWKNEDKQFNTIMKGIK